MDKKKLFSVVFIILIFSLLFGNILQNWQQIKSASVHFTLPQVLLIIIVAVLLHFLNSSSWHLMTKALNFNIGFKDNIRIWMFPNMTRYIPGLVWQYVGRVYLLSKHGVSKSMGALAVLFDALFTFSIGALVVMLTMSYEFKWILLFIIPIPLILPFLFSNQKLINILLFWIKKLTQKSYTSQAPRFRIHWLLILSFITFSQFIFAGVMLYLIAGGFTSLNMEVIPVFAGVYAGSWILGYISFFAPGGLGVQELSIAGLLSIFMPFSVASVIALLFRCALIIGEVILLTFAFWKSGKWQDRLSLAPHKGR